MKRLKLFIASFGALFMTLVPATAVVHADIANDIRNGACSATDSANCATQSADEAQAGIQGIIKKVVNIISIIVGAVSVIMIIIGGFKYITSGGESGGVTGAKNTILYALVGLVVILFAQLLVNFVITKVAP